MTIKTIAKPKELSEAEDRFAVMQRSKSDSIAARNAAQNELNALVSGGASAEQRAAVAAQLDAASTRLADLKSAESACRPRLVQMREEHADAVSAAMVPLRHAAAERILTALETIADAGRDLHQTEHEMGAAGVPATDWLRHNGLLDAVKIIAERIKAEQPRSETQAA